LDVVLLPKRMSKGSRLLRAEGSYTRTLINSCNSSGRK
jgi:hypothetical protein